MHVPNWIGWISEILQIMTYKSRHFYFNKYILSLLRREKYHLSYDYKHKALWFRTYKVASRSIDDSLRDESKPGQYIYGSQMSYSPRLFRKYFKFAFVRNPETRFISAWKDKVMKQNYFNFEDTKHEEMKDFDQFLSWVEQLNIDRCDEHLRSQNSLIDLNHIDFIGRFEHFNHDFQQLTDRIGLKDQSAKHLNKSPKQELSLTHTQRLRIYKIYEKDFQIFYPNHLETLMDEHSKT